MGMEDKKMGMDDWGGDVIELSVFDREESPSWINAFEKTLLVIERRSVFCFEVPFLARNLAWLEVT